MFGICQSMPTYVVNCWFDRGAMRGMHACVQRSEGNIVSRYDGEPGVFVIEHKRTRGLETKEVNVKRFGDVIRSPRVHVPFSLAATCHL
jgi:hypothetical protein